MSSTSLFGDLLRKPLSLVALLWIAVLVIAAVGAPVFAPYSPLTQHLDSALQGPTPTHILGTDQLGRDILSRLLFGARVSLTGALIATSVAVALGVISGLIAGYFRSILDTVLSGVADLLMSIPVIVILLSVAAVFARNQVILMVVLGILLSAGMFRAVRASTLDVHSELYIAAARTSGLSTPRIIARHILPRIAGISVVQAAILASVALVTQLGLGFLGLDTPPPTPSWGNLVHDASTSIGVSLWPIIPPTVVVGITVLAFSAIGDITQQRITGHGQRDNARRRRSAPKQSQAHPDKSETARPGIRPDAIAPRSLVELRGVSITVHKDDELVTLVDDLSFSIGAGEVVGLVGESGAGKSITARSILGALPTGVSASGAIVFDGVDVLQLTERERSRIRGTEIAFISQEPMVSLSPAFRVGHQLAEIVRTHRGVSRGEAKAIAIQLLETVEISDPAHVARLYPHEISGGMAQRVMIAIALAGEPRLIVADEPTTALDVSVQMQILELLRSLQQERLLAVLIVTHDWGVVADICDRAVVMYAGQVVEEAVVAEVISHPRHPYTSALRSADPHSQIRHERLITIPGQVPQPGQWPVGCRFADRCALATAACTAEPVALTVVEDTHTVRCLRAAELGVRHDV